MLETLDQIDWSKLRHSYGSAENTPRHLRMLLSDNADERSEAYYHLYGAVNHQGDVNSATVAVVPFLFELLASNSTPERERIVEVLHTFVSSCAEHLQRRDQSNYTLPPAYFRFEMETYLNVSKGVMVLLTLIEEDLSADLRYRVIALLGELADHRDTILPVLWRHLLHEQEQRTLVALLKSITLLFARLWLQEASDPYSAYLLEMASQHQQPQVRLYAAIAAVAAAQIRSYGHRDVPESVTDLLADALSNPIPYGLNFISYEPMLLEPLLQMSVENMGQTLAYQQISPYAAHLIVRIMLDRVFDGRGAPLRIHPIYDWRPYEIGGKWSEFGMYTLPRDHHTYQADNLLNKQQRFVLTQILACTPFWEMKTNLFSFFFGLPDDRAELEALLRQ